MIAVLSLAGMTATPAIDDFSSMIPKSAGFMEKIMWQIKVIQTLIDRLIRRRTVVGDAG
jgi:hypothetical protein